MGKVIHRIDAPLVARLMVGDMRDSVDDRVAHIDVRARHVYLGAQNFFAVCKFALGHSAEEVEVLFNRAVAVGAVFARLCKSAAVFAYFLGRQVADIRLALLDELYRALVEKIEIARCVVDLVPFVAEPLNVLFYRVDIFDILFRGIRVVETEIAHSAVFFRDAEVDAYRLCVADVQIAVGLRRESRLHAGVDPVCKILVYKISDKI